MYPCYQLIQIVELPENGGNKYAVRFLAQMEYFDYDFMCKNALKEFLFTNKYDSGEYLIIRDNEEYGDIYVTEAVCIYRCKDKGSYVDFKIAGEEWKNLVKEVLEKSPIIKPSLQIQTMHKLSVPKIIPEKIYVGIGELPVP